MTAGTPVQDFALAEFAQRATGPATQAFLARVRQWSPQLPETRVFAFPSDTAATHVLAYAPVPMGAGDTQSVAAVLVGMLDGAAGGGVDAASDGSATPGAGSAFAGLVDALIDYVSRAGIQRIRITDLSREQTFVRQLANGDRPMPLAVADSDAPSVSEFSVSAEATPAGLQIPPAWANPDAHSMHEQGQWGEFWESIREQHAAFSAEARDYVERLEASVPLNDSLVALDFGCGFGHVARYLAPKVGTLALWDGSAHVRRLARIRVAHLRNIELVDLATAAELERERGRYDLILAHSVIQYMEPDELQRWCATWRSMLRPGGRIVLSDLIQPDVRVPEEVFRIFKFSLQNGILRQVFREKLRQVKRYSKTRRGNRLAVLTPAHMREVAARAGLALEVLPRNLSYRESRKTISLTPSA